MSSRAGAGGDSYYVAQINREAATPEGIEAARREGRDIAALITTKSACAECQANPGAPCTGLETGVHLSRQLEFVRSGSWT